VQFGLPYGVNNQDGQVRTQEASEIVAYGRAHGIDTVDTAIAYGESELRLGEIGMQGWRVITKLPAVPSGVHDIAQWMRESVEQSLRRLKVTTLQGLLLHQPLQLFSSEGDAIYEGLLALKRQGIVEKIGVSVYSPDDLEQLCLRFHFDLVQAPFNVFDRRLAQSGWLRRLHQLGTEVHVRSVFLQGLLLMEIESRPAQFKRWDALWRRWHTWLADEQLTALTACLAFAFSFAEISRVVVGADSVQQLQEIIATARTSTDVPMPPEILSTDDLELIHPSEWN
jgi:aryl-alcohol dehydrogenase-like predicted oxidoreductase